MERTKCLFGSEQKARTPQQPCLPIIIWLLQKIKFSLFVNRASFFVPFFLQFGQDGRCPGIRRLLGRTKVVRHLAVLGHEGEAFATRHDGRGHLEAQGLGQGGLAAVGQKANARVGASRRASPGLTCRDIFCPNQKIYNKTKKQKAFR